MTRMGRPKSANPRNKRINVRLENDIYDKFSKECERLNVDKATLLYRWIIAFLDNKKE